MTDSLPNNYRLCNTHHVCYPDKLIDCPCCVIETVAQGLVKTCDKDAADVNRRVAKAILAANLIVRQLQDEINRLVNDPEYYAQTRQRARECNGMLGMKVRVAEPEKMN
jgi:hypothetical protein